MREWLEAFILHSSVFRQGRNALCLLMALPIVLMAGEDKSGQKTQAANHLVGPDARASRPGGDTTAPPASQARLVEAYGKLPLRFEANQGQTDRQVKFLSRGRGYGLFLTPAEAVLALQGQSQKSKVKSQKAKSGIEDAARSALRTPNPETPTPAVLRMKLVGANPNPQIQGLEELPGKSNYFVGNDPKLWRTGVANYAKVQYHDVYPGVTLVYYGNQGQLEYDWVVAPGADPKAIKFAIEGTEKVSIDPKGDLVLQIEGGEVRFHKLVVYQEESGVRSQESGAKDQGGQRTKDHRQFLDGRYVLRAANPKSKIENPKFEVGFEVASYDPRKPLVIDPVLSYATYLGGGARDWAFPIAVDSSGSAYVAGNTTSANFPTTVGAYDTTCGTDGNCNSIVAVSSLSPVPDAFVTKISADGTTLVYSTYLGGSGEDDARGIAVDGSGNAYVTGFTASTDFPVNRTAFQTTGSGADAFIAKLDPTGASLLYATYLGGSTFQFGRGIAVDTSGNAFVTGYTESTNFPTTVGAFQTTTPGGTCGTASPFPCDHGFVTKMNPTGTGLVYSTYLGGSAEDLPFTLAVDASGNAYVGGNTTSTDFPTTVGAYKGTFQGMTSGCDVSVTQTCGDAFVTKLNAAGSAPVYSTFLGGTGDETIGFSGIALDASGNIYAAGYTNSTDFPVTSGAFQTVGGVGGTCGVTPNTFSCNDAFVTKLNAAGSALVYSTYLGGTADDSANGIAVDASGFAYVVGSTGSTDFPIASAIQPACASCANLLPDIFVTKLDGAGSALIFSTYLGGTSYEQGNAIGVDASGNAYIAGLTASTDFPTTVGSVQTTYGGGTEDGFVAKLSGLALPVATISPVTVPFGNVNVGTLAPFQAVTVTNLGDATLTFSSFNIGPHPTLPGFADFFSSDSLVSPCGSSLAGGASCVRNVFFQPSAVGNEGAVLTITDDARGVPGTTQTVTLTGTGVSLGVAGGLPASFNFGSLLVGKTSPVHAFTLTNTGASPLGIQGIGATGNFDVVGTTCPIGGSLAAGASCFIDVTFTAGSPGVNSGDLEVQNDGANSPAVVTLLGTGTTLATNPLVAFTPKTDYTTGTTPFGGAAGDFNSDGKVDLVIANYGSNNVTVFLGNGDGTFQTGVNYPAGTNPTSVEAKDVTGDGIIDLIVTDQNAASPAAGAVQLLAGKGDGTFQAAVSLGTFNGPNSVAFGDFNHDGIRDLAIAEGGGGAGTTVAVLLGTGGGNFQSPVTYTVPVNPATIARDDFNNDGNQDLAVLSNIGSLSILLGNGDGTFQNAVSYPTGSFPNGRMAFEDFNGDGSDDIAVAQSGSDSVGVFLNNGSGGFPTRTDYPVTGARAVTTADFNGDGKFDLAVADQSNGLVWIFIGNGDGTFRTPAISFPTTSTPKDVGGLDLNGDGMPDIAVAGSLSILLNTAASFSTYSVTFGNQLVATTSLEQTITLTNASNSVPINVGGFTPSGDFSDTTETCTTSPVAPGTSCTVKVTFTPTALGTRTGSLSISSDAVGSPHVINLTGTGTGTPAVSLTTVNFPGNPAGKPDCPTKPVTLSNTGNIPLTFVSATVPAGSPFIITNTCPTTLAVGASLPCIQVQFVPPGVGSYSETLTVTTSPASTGNTVLLTGTGTLPCALLAAVHTATLLRGTDAQDFAIQDGKPSCSPVSLNLSCSVTNPAACALNPAVIAPSGSSTLRVSNLKAVRADSVAVQVNSLSEFRTASELISVRFADFAFTQAPDTATILAGETANYSLAIRPVNGLAGPLSLSCSGAPRGATCTVTPSAVTLDGSSLAQVKVGVSTTARATALPPIAHLPFGFGGDGAHRVLMLILLLVGLAGGSAAVSAASRQDACAPRLTRLALGVALLAMLLWASCGGGGSMSFNSGGTPAGTFTLTITGTYTAAPGSSPATLSNTTALTLNVN